ncbi:hypothetical protein NQZ68_008497 [Dissostichus eleginoides]|nr:hypothetical protein NQZ68_008497 [Dissostichus eleginoides]
MLLFVERTDALSLHLNATSNFRVCWTAQAGQVRNAMRVRGHFLHGHRVSSTLCPNAASRSRSPTLPSPTATATALGVPDLRTGSSTSQSTQLSQSVSATRTANARHHIRLVYVFNHCAFSVTVMYLRDRVVALRDFTVDVSSCWAWALMYVSR